MIASRSFRVGLPLLLSGAGALGCTPFEPPPEGALGEERLVYFQPPDDAIFSERLATGSRFVLTAEARLADDAARVAAATVASSDPAIVTVSPVEPAEGEEDAEGFVVELVGAGEAYLELEDDEGLIDRIRVRAARPAKLELHDALLSGSSVDTRLPRSFGLVADSEAIFGVSAEDQCGGPLLSVDAVEVTSSDPEVLALSNEGGILHDAEALVPGEVEITLTPAAGQARSFTVSVVEGAVDDVEIEIAAAQSNQAELWGRAFADDTELIGVSFNWDSSERVSVSPGRGPSTVATIYVPPEGQPADNRPAIVDLSAYDEEDSVDLLTLRTDQIVTGRVQDEDEAPSGPSLPSCGSEACDPYAAGLVGALFLTRLRRRRRA